jgi:protein gp37
MSEHSAISWTDATFNPWWGCTKVSPACDHCYAERDAHRFAPGRVLWGVGADRRTFGDKHWNEPLRWAKTLPAKLGRRPRVFCASMADVFDKDAPETERHRLWQLIRGTPELDWLLLTKRIGNVPRYMPGDWQAFGLPANVWLGATVVNQEEADRDIPKLLELPARVRFLSIEPMLGPVRIPVWRVDVGRPDPFGIGLHWVIAGGESGPQARPMHPDWPRALRNQCITMGVPFHFKQWGEWAVARPDHHPTKAPHWWTANAGNVVSMVRVGKAAAGRALDGIEHNGFPA